ncbi:sigma-54-dependent Fis family transcriptional regulator [Zooshikella ganghwensis]|uniref:GAF domain-containing protein n=1 Tax=Zooshikella ganghwensis TaxID=202772 RepID=A0A4P9VRS5_9GAMM|nr:sigma 54-interacting transcriptional regulator [Zooshikella ganghwensis]RDH45766.1 GAF domain-containing protein [Zooshikella ganghwensis]
MSAISVEELLATSVALATERDIDRLAQQIVLLGCKLCTADGGAIYILDITKSHLEPKAVVWQGKPIAIDYATDVPLREHGQFNTQNIYSYVAFTGQQTYIDSAYQFAGFELTEVYQRDQLLKCKSETLLVMPLRDCNQQTLGVLELFKVRNGHSSSFREVEKVAQAFALQAAVALDNAMLMAMNRHLIQVLDASNRQLEAENKQLRLQRKSSQNYEIIGESEPMQQVYALMDKVLSSNVTVLLRGETGTGKEVFARAIHQHSDRNTQLFVTQNCAAVPEHLLESELFGYKKGSFTGAATDRKGLLDEAHRGTLFLDEIGDMPLNLQTKLLRVLQEGEVKPIGENKAHKVDVRIIAATHCNLEEKITKGEFREDLYYRLSVFPIALPPLRERKEDIPALINHFIKGYCQTYGRKVTQVSPAVMDILMRYNFPGNVRQLQNIIERAVLLCDKETVILPQHMPDQILLDNGAALEASDELPVYTQNELPLKEMVQQYEKKLLESHLRANNWNQTQTAKVLKMPRRTLVEKIQRYRIHNEV